jgi:BirA family biotin operon repressor/biotin-[acetyl-CoA-carboxylase] ligase
MQTVTPNLIALDSVPSTSSYLATIADTLPDGTVVVTREQTAGRGQRGNSWEAEPGANLTFSLLLRPEGVKAVEQFAISEAVALGIVTALQAYMPGVDVRIKWPNDIYANGRKICGILIENAILGTEIRRSIAGIGINVNQTVWRSDAPNPVSMAQLTGKTFDLDTLLTDVFRAIYAELSNPNHDAVGVASDRQAEESVASDRHRVKDEDVILDRHSLKVGNVASDRHSRYMAALWGRDALTYRDTATGEIFRASIASIAPDGMMTLAPLDGSPYRTYAFKEVAVIL